MTPSHPAFDLLSCPRTGSPLRPASSAELEDWTRRTGGNEGLEAGWIDAERQWLYGEEDGVPILIPERARSFEADARGTNRAHPVEAAWRSGQERAWAFFADRWAKMPSPMRPIAEDTALAALAIQDWQRKAAGAAPSALLLGVTPESALLDWPEGTRLLAVDCSMEMIRKVWPGDRTPHARVVCGDWSALPVQDASCDLVLGDGVFTTLPFPGGAGALIGELTRVLQPGGEAVVRLFARPEAQESVVEVIQELKAGRVGSIDVFRWRLGMAVHGTLEEGVRLGDTWNAWHEGIPDPAALMEDLGWPAESATFLGLYKDNDARMTFPTIRELSDAFAHSFQLVDCSFPGYEMGDRCPTLRFVRT